MAAKKQAKAARKSATKTVARKTTAKKSAKKTTKTVAKTVAKKAAKAVTKKSARTSPAKRAAKKSVAPRKSAPVAKPGEVVLVSGGNPQIPKGYGDAVVQSYIEAMPGWKRDIGRRIDAIIERVVPNVEKAVKWNTPIYGMRDDGWFCGYHCFAKYVKVTFFRGTSLKPVPPGLSKHKEVRYLDVYEDALDEQQFAAWVKQASKLPGEKM